MPLLTPLRIALTIVTFSLLSFLWTFGVPRPMEKLSQPVIDHYNNLHVHKASVTSGTRTGSATATATIRARPGLDWHDGHGGFWRGDEEDLMTDGKPDFASIAPPEPTHPIEQFCQNVPNAHQVVVNIRTSKAEINKLSKHFSNLLTCVPNFAIFSDHSGVIEGHEVHDVLQMVGGEAKLTHAEFKEYRLIQADEDHRIDSGKTKELDKWKFLPMVYKAYELNPDARFHIFIEADISISWSNLLQWVRRLDYRIPYYSGAPVFLSGTRVAQRSAGILLSQGALRRYAKSYEEKYTSKWEADVGKECCGDLMLGRALADAHVEYYSSWPLVQGEKPETLDYSTKTWCTPAVSWRHINGDDMDKMWEREKNWIMTNGWNKPFLFRDAFYEYVQQHIEPRKDEWDNMSQDAKILAPQGRQQRLEEDERNRRQKEDKANQQAAAAELLKVKEKEKEKEEKEQAAKAAKDFQYAESEMEEGDDAEESTPLDSRRRRRKRESDEDQARWDKIGESNLDAGDSPARCEKVCDSIPDCLQWRYSKKGDGECHLSKVLRLGMKTEGDGGEDKWVSGWLIDRVKKMEEVWKCDEVHWQFYQ